jgi:ABC-type amino acid transport substrate-binding protein
MPRKTRPFVLITALLLPSLWPTSSLATEELHVVLRSASVFVSDGESAPEGFDVDILNMFVSWYGRRSGEEVTYRTTTVKTVPDLLERARSGQCDLAIGSITITAERDRTVDFSTPYLPLRSVVIARRGTFDEGSLDELLQGRRIGAEAGTTHEKFGAELAEQVPDLKLDVSFATLPDLLQALAGPSPTVDAAITDITHYWIMSQSMDLVLVGTVGPVQGLGVVLPEGSPLKPPLDDFLTELRHSHTYFSLVERYFGNEAARMVRSSRAEP